MPVIFSYFTDIIFVPVKV